MNNSPRKLLMVVGVIAALSSFASLTLAWAAGPPIARDRSQFPSVGIGSVASTVAPSRAPAVQRFSLNSLSQILTRSPHKPASKTTSLGQTYVAQDLRQQHTLGK